MIDGETLFPIASCLVCPLDEASTDQPVLESICSGGCLCFCISKNCRCPGLEPDKPTLEEEEGPTQ